MKWRVNIVLLMLAIVFSLTLATFIRSPGKQSITCRHNPPKILTALDPAIHDKCEGISVPLNETDILLTEVEMSVRPVFWMCMVENYDFIVDCRLTFTNPTVDPQTTTLAFPFSTHDIYGDHEEFQAINVFEGDNPVPYSVALNSSLYSFEEGGLFFKGVMINCPVHPLLEEANDMAELAPRLYGDDFEMVVTGI